MKKNKDNTKIPGKKTQPVPPPKSADDAIGKKRDVDHGDINYDPDDPHGLKIKKNDAEEKK